MNESVISSFDRPRHPVIGIGRSRSGATHVTARGERLLATRRMSYSRGTARGRDEVVGIRRQRSLTHPPPTRAESATRPERRQHEPACSSAVDAVRVQWNGTVQTHGDGGNGFSSSSPQVNLPRLMSMTRTCLTLCFFLHAAFAGATNVWGQHHDHTGHDAHAGHGGSGGWLMPPMDPEMQMLPGLETAVPPVTAWLPHFDLDPAAFPVAEPSRPVDLQPGDTLDLVAAPVRRRIGGREYLMYGYNNQYPGPLIRAQKGSTVFIRVRNEIQSPTTVHWHGIRLDQPFDGVPGLSQRLIEIGETFLYRVKVPDGGMFWYHPHHREDVQQGLGLYGNLLVVDDREEAEPFHRAELLTLDDVHLSDTGELLPFGLEAPVNALMGRYGNVMLVNGSADHRIDARRGEVIRFYITNVANARPFNVRFGDAPIKLVASDAGFFERDQWIPSVIIHPSERYIVDVRFTESGSFAITNTIQAINHLRGTFFPHVDTLAIVTVADEPVVAGREIAFETLQARGEITAEISSLSSHFDRPPDHTLTTTLTVRNLPLPLSVILDADTFFVPPVEWNDGMPDMNWLATGDQVTWILEDATGKRNEQIHWRFSQGEIVKIRVFNDPRSVHPMQHPIHIHGQRFLVIARDGIPQDNLAWKDTAVIPVGSTMDLLVEMTNPGDWMIHCHIAEHLSAGMHFHFTVEAD